MGLGRQNYVFVPIPLTFLQIFKKKLTLSMGARKNKEKEKKTAIYFEAKEPSPPQTYTHILIHSSHCQYNRVSIVCTTSLI